MLFDGKLSHEFLVNNSSSTICHVDAEAVASLRQVVSSSRFDVRSTVSFAYIPSQSGKERRNFWELTGAYSKAHVEDVLASNIVLSKLTSLRWSKEEYMCLPDCPLSAIVFPVDLTTSKSQAVFSSCFATHMIEVIVLKVVASILVCWYTMEYLGRLTGIPDRVSETPCRYRLWGVPGASAYLVKNSVCVQPFGIVGHTLEPSGGCRQESQIPIATSSELGRRISRVTNQKEHAQTHKASRHESNEVCSQE
ncbi:hypothetical protein KCU73_g81, partial [Aureobasidium melanogenum]